MPAERPFQNNSIFELISIFDLHNSDSSVLELLAAELTSRKGKKAKELETKVQRALNATPMVFGGQQLPKPAQDSADGSYTPAPGEPIQGLGPLPTLTLPKSEDDPMGILTAWIALEALSPQTYRKPADLGADRYCVADLTRGTVPWNLREKSRPNRQLYYQVILGAIRMDRATDDLVKAFGEDEERSRREREKAAIATVLVDKDGFVLKNDAVAVSSFAWALPLALELKLQSLGAWPRIERSIQDSLEKMVRRFDREGKPIPLDLPTIQSAYRWLVDQFHLPAHLVEAPSFAIRIYHYYKAKNPPEASLLNSFFLADLARVSELVQAKQAGTGLRRYLRIEATPNTRDIFPPSESIDPFVAPDNTVPVRWPSPGGHPLVLLQQAAVNAARGELANASGILAVNGPPGTGKTTLLRDLVAACVFDRAAAMASFSDPNAAFSTTGQTMAVGANAFFHFYRPDPSLRGHEVLVASSNNKAVENVSLELPVKKACGRDFRHFCSISDIVANPKAHGVEGDESSPQQTGIETWGLIAAALGNAKNRFNFQQSFWWHGDGFRIYLKAAKGDSVLIEIKDPETGRILERKTPGVVLKEKPPASPAAAMAAWSKIRIRFLEMKDSIEAELKSLEQDRQECLRLPEDERRLHALEAERAPIAATAAVLSEAFERCVAEDKALEAALQRRTAFRMQHHIGRPGFFARLFGSTAWRIWKTEDDSLAADVQTAQQALKVAERARDDSGGRFKDAADRLRDFDEKLAKQRTALKGRQQKVAQIRSRLGDRVLDAAFFAKSHEVIQMTAPWLPDGLHRKREDLFLASLEVHKAFIDAAAQKVLHNINILMTAFNAGTLQDKDKKALLGDLWSTLFMAIPVISTTFASVNSMLGDLLPESLGWLLIDEAGQALPQAAVGAIMRAKRTLVVGDPMQIPPVVTLPERLNAEICSFFKVTRPLWAAPAASAQTLADRTSRLRSAFRSDQGQRHVGTPLLVHRRCQEPMFTISNIIAYDGQMVYAAGAKQPGEVGCALGPSRWLDIDGEAQSKWCPEEGELVLRQLVTLARHGIAMPDLFIISPFRVVAQEMRYRLEQERDLLRAFAAPASWWDGRIGTIHTFQGREAETVILLLGAPNATQGGARQWAAGQPNILNVAVSRAKQNFYVVGSFGAWSGTGHFRELGRMLPVERFNSEARYRAP